jgi:hypothetical protein
MSTTRKARYEEALVDATLLAMQDRVTELEMALALSHAVLLDPEVAAPSTSEAQRAWAGALLHAEAALGGDDPRPLGRRRVRVDAALVRQARGVT